MEAQPKIDIRYSLQCVLTRKIRESGLKEYGSPSAREELVRLSKEALQEIMVPEAERESWMAFCKKVFDTTNKRFDV